MPDPEFYVGMSLQELEQIIGSRYSTWERKSKKRALNNRKDVSLPTDAKSEYLQMVVLSLDDREKRRSFRYSFALTSPLSDARVYSVGFVVESATSSLIAVDRWFAEMSSRWGDPPAGTLSDVRARATYFLDAQWNLIENAARKCASIYPALYRLDEKSIEQVAATSDLLDVTGCRFARDGQLTIKDRVVIRSTFRTVDFTGQVRDVLKRVAFGTQ